MKKENNNIYVAIIILLICIPLSQFYNYIVNHIFNRRFILLLLCAFIIILIVNYGISMCKIIYL
jgi:hypothetical protein